MTEHLRRAGRGLDATGAELIWVVSAGRRGRRWREVRVLDGSVASSMLLETDPDGRFSHLELATAVGLLTLHPEPDGSLHGNAVTDRGVNHVVALPFDPDGAVIVEGSTFALAAALGGPASRGRGGDPVGPLDAGSSLVGPLLVVALDLSIGRGRLADLPAITLDAEGLPMLAAAESWPLERDAADSGPVRG